MKNLNSLTFFLFFFSVAFATSFAQQNDSNARILLIALCQKNEPIQQFLETISTQTIFYQIQTVLILQEDENIRVPSFENLNIYYAQTFNRAGQINTIIKESLCEFIMIVHINDRLFTNTLRKYILNFERSPQTDIFYADYYVTYDNSNFESDRQNYWYFVKLNPPKLEDLCFNLTSSHWMWRSSIHQKIGYFNEDFNYLNRLEFLNRAMQSKLEFKKMSSPSGTVYCNYKEQQAPFKNDDDIKQYYKEYSLLKQIYQKEWQPQDQFHLDEKPFVIITPSYNNQNWYQFNLDSLLSQQYTNYRIIYINDNSDDEMGALVKEYLNLNDRKNRVTFFDNNQRRGALANIYHAIHSCNPNEIILLVDGDDWLAHPYILQQLNHVYHDPLIWMTYGQFIWFPQLIPGSAQEISQEIITHNTFRESAWASTHLRTFYAGLFQQIDKKDLLDTSGNFFSMAWDLAIMFPMLEMTGRHSLFISDILYVYNTANTISDHKINITLQQELADHIRKKQKYTPLLSFH